MSKKKIKINKDALKKGKQWKGESEIERRINDKKVPQLNTLKHLPDMDLSEQDNQSAQDAMTSSVEYYMIQGIDSTPRLAELLGMTCKTVESLKKRIYNRWSIVSPEQRESQKGKLMATYQMLLSKSINIMETVDDPKTTLSAIRMAKDIVKDVSELSGVKAIEGSTTNNLQIIAGDNKRANIQEMAKTFNKFLSQAPVDDNIIDVEVEESPPRRKRIVK